MCFEIKSICFKPNKRKLSFLYFVFLINYYKNFIMKKLKEWGLLKTLTIIQKII